MQFVSLT